VAAGIEAERERRTVAKAMKVTLVTFTVAALVVAAAGCGGRGGSGEASKTFEGDGDSFSYPGEWLELTPVEARAQTGDEVSSVNFGPRAGADVLGVVVYRLRASVSGATSTRFQLRLLQYSSSSSSRRKDGLRVAPPG
jgi:hypothetical protein